MSKQNDTDILRAEDILPPYTEKSHQHRKQPDKSNPIDTVQKAGEIPKFDLADHIMSEQRKTAAIKRKGPDRIDKTINHKQNVRYADYNIKQQLKLSQGEQIIAEIVARDIQKLCRGDV
jgi:hypothetical protein